MKKASNKLSTGNLADVYQIKTRYERIADGVSQCSVLGPYAENYDLPSDKVIMLVGGTGTGKSTLINRIANHILGVNYKDRFRFELIHTACMQDQTESQTSSITIYKFFKNPTLHFNLSIIDTPGFGDTRGKTCDQATIQTIKKMFDSGKVLSLNGIGFVVRHSDIRLSEGQRYVFHKIVEIFSHDVENIFFTMITHCDDPDAPSPVQEALKKENIPNDKIFPFNNNRLTSNTGVLQKAFWEMSFESCISLLETLESTDAISLALSKEILEKRENAQIKLESVSERVKEGLMKVEELKMDQEALKNKETEIKSNSDFEYTTKEQFTIMVKIVKKNHKAVRCSKCEIQCHYPCTITKKEKLKWCRAMSRFNKTLKPNCVVCTGKCHWSDHYLSDQIATLEQRTVTRNKEDLKAKYDVLVGEKNVYEKLIKSMEKKLTEVYENLITNILEMHTCIKFINEVGMKCTSLVPLTFENHIQKLISLEKKKHKDGYNERIKCYEKIIKMVQEGDDQAFSLLDNDSRVKAAKTFFDKY